MERSVETAEGRTGLQTEASTLSPPTVHLQGNTVVTLCVRCVCVCVCHDVFKADVCYEVECGRNWFLSFLFYFFSPLLTRRWLGAKEWWIWWSELCPPGALALVNKRKRSRTRSDALISASEHSKCQPSWIWRWHLNRKPTVSMILTLLLIKLLHWPVPSSIIQKAPFPLENKTHTHARTHTL